jgi:WD40 repeat protein
VELSALVVAHDGGRIASADEAGWIQIWDSAEGEAEFPAFRLRKRPSYPALAFEPDDRVVVTLDAGEARRWRLADSLAVGSPLPPLGRIAPAPRTLEGAGGTVVVEAKDDRAILRSTSEKKVIAELAIHRPRLLATSRDGALFVVADQASRPVTVRVFRFRDGASVGKPLLHLDGLRCAAIAPDGARVATGDGRDVLRIWDVESGSPIGPALRKAADLLALDYSVDGTLLLAGYESGEARLLDSTDGTLIGGPIQVKTDGSFRLPVPVHAVAFDPDGKTFEVAGLGSKRWKRRVPVPVEGDAKQVALWASSVTGLELDAFDQVVPLASERWQALRRSRGERSAAGPGPGSP